jgi:hypothetical protein
METKNPNNVSSERQCGCGENGDACDEITERYLVYKTTLFKHHLVEALLVIENENRYNNETTTTTTAAECEHDVISSCCDPREYNTKYTITVVVTFQVDQFPYIDSDRNIDHCGGSGTITSRCDS